MFFDLMLEYRQYQAESNHIPIMPTVLHRRSAYHQRYRYRSEEGHPRPLLDQSCLDDKIARHFLQLQQLGRLRSTVNRSNLI